MINNDVYNIFGISIKKINGFEYVITQIHDKHRYADLFKALYPDEFSFLITQHNNEKELYEMIYNVDSKTLESRTELYLLHDKESYDRLIIIIRQFKIDKLKMLSNGY